MPHICGDEVVAFLMAMPALGYCLRCIKLKFQAMRKAGG